MQGVKRRVVYVSLYEAIAICVASVGFLAFSREGLSAALPLSVACSVVAVVWNLSYNWLFEKWEATRKTKGRSIGLRVVHSLGFEGGLALVLLPLIAWWLDITLLEALIADIGLLIFFLVYTFVFNWTFDRVFGLPAAAMGTARLS
ncbi:PACE efflux transporter [soil metagenome]